MKTFVEASFKVDVAGLPPIFMDAKSSVEIRKKLRRQLKFPDDIENIERITKGEKIKSFKDRLKTTLSAKGQDVEEAAAEEDMLIDPKKMAKKSSFLSPQNTDKLKMDLAALKKKLGPNHPLNKPKTEAKDPAEYDEEGGMVKGQLRTMIDAAQELHDSLDKDDNLPEWVQSKVTKATDYIDSVRDYMASEKDDD